MASPDRHCPVSALLGIDSGRVAHYAGSEVTGALQHAGGDGGVATCKHCDAVAVGPCARCHEPVCGDCCVLTKDSVGTWAICLACAEYRGKSLRSGWTQVVVWLLVPLGVVALLLWALSAAFKR